MVNKKRLSEISWQVSEEEYRADPALSYSTLSRFNKEGFNNLSHLFDKETSPSLTFGSMVDTLLTDGQEAFDSRFFVSTLPSISESLETIGKVLFERYSDTYHTLIDIPEDIIAEVGKEFGYYTADKYKNYRVKQILENCGLLYSTLYLSSGKELVTSEQYQDALNCISALKDSDATSFYFAKDNPIDGIERYYQLKFKFSHNGVDYRSMADLIIVNTKTKEIIPCDLKTSSKPEWDFYKSFIQWDYALQARLYWRNIRDNLNRDEYFKDFVLKDYRFIVVNKQTLTPLVWEFPFTQAESDLYLGRNKNILIKDPYSLGKELHTYLNSEPKVPNGINLNTPNILTEWISTM